MGINARDLGLTGALVHIGQIEPSRPGLRVQNGDNAANSHPDVRPADVFLQNRTAIPNMNVDSHPIEVAGVMIANGARDRGIAPQAILHASAYGEREIAAGAYEEALLSMQHIAGMQASAINMSWGKPVRPGGAYDGTSLLSQGLDYLARKWDTVYVMSKGNVGGETPIPKDSYNGLVVGRTDPVGGVFRRAGRENPWRAEDGRIVVGVTAPGFNIRVPSPTADGQGRYSAESGTSYAAPHVTGTIALLQEDGTRQNLPASFRRHEVMKAVVMNSAEKVQGRLDMTRTVLKQFNPSQLITGIPDLTWDQSDARDEPSQTGDPVQDGLINLSRMMLPLDEEMGTGFLNASRAQRQLRGGQFQPQTPNTAAIGWNYRSSPGEGNFDRYTLRSLRGGSWISLTLTWDRQITRTENPNVRNNDPNLYDWDGTNGDSFGNPQLSNLDLFLVPAGGGIDQSIWRSISTQYNVEHIVFHLPPGNTAYDVLVQQNSSTVADYALAWWAEGAPAAPANVRHIGDKVWMDLDSDGLQDSGEPGLADVHVDLYSSDGVLVDSTTTDYYGNYGFDASPGTYYMTFTAPYGMEFTSQDTGSDEGLDSDVNSAGQTVVFTVATADDLTMDAGLVTLPYGSIGDYVWNDANANGIQDVAESGMSDVQVELFTPGGTYLARTRTDSNGHYSFRNVGPGSYYVVVQAPVNYSFTSPGQGGSQTADSDVDSTGRTSAFSLGLGEDKLDIDAGLLLGGGSVLGYVWHDLNHNGLQESDEPGFSNVTVELHTPSGSLVGNTATDEDGHYSFVTQPSGQYCLVFVVPQGYMFTLADAGDDSIDSDAGFGGNSQVFSLGLGESLFVDAGLQGRPVANDDSVVVDEDAVAYIDVTVNDGDPEGDPLTISILPGLSHGTAVVSDNGTPDDPSDDYIAYAPAAGYNGTDTLTYQISDAFGGAANGTVTITVDSINDPPVAESETFSVNEDTGLLGSSILANDDDSHGGAPGENNVPLTAQLVAGPAHAASFTLNQDGTFSYTPAANFNGTDSFTYQAVDSPGGVSNTATVTITVNAVNDAPVAVADSYTTALGEAPTVAAPGLLANDTDADFGDVLTATLVALPAHGTLTAFNSNGSFTYTPAAGYIGSDSFTYKVNDGHVDGNTVTVTLHVTGLQSFTGGDGQTFGVSSSGVLWRFKDNVYTSSGFTAVKFAVANIGDANASNDLVFATDSTGKLSYWNNFTAWVYGGGYLADFEAGDNQVFGIGFDALVYRYNPSSGWANSGFSGAGEVEVGSKGDANSANDLVFLRRSGVNDVWVWNQSTYWAAGGYLQNLVGGDNQVFGLGFDSGQVWKYRVSGTGSGWWQSGGYGVEIVVSNIGDSDPINDVVFVRNSANDIWMWNQTNWTNLNQKLTKMAAGDGRLFGLDTAGQLMTYRTSTPSGWYSSGLYGDDLAVGHRMDASLADDVAFLRLADGNLYGWTPGSLR